MVLNKRVCARACVLVCSSEDNLWSRFSPFPMWILGSTLRPSGLVAMTFPPSHLACPYRHNFVSLFTSFDSYLTVI